MNKHKTYIIFATIVAVVAVTVAVFFGVKSSQSDAQIDAITGMLDDQKLELESEYSNLSMEFSEFTPTLKNDSLIQLVDEQKTKIEELLQELKQTKSTDARRIQQLKDELASVRRVLQYYVTQIDSLSTQNQKLVSENTEIRQKYHASSQTVEQLAKEKEDLTITVTRAAIIEMSNFKFTALNSKGRTTKKLTQVANLQFAYTIAKNITAVPGDKTLYLRIARPDEVVLTKNAQQNVFPFESKLIAYSARKDFEYANEDVNGIIYYNVDEMLVAGEYRADFFLDGNRIGSYKFEL